MKFPFLALIDFAGLQLELVGVRGAGAVIGVFHGYLTSGKDKTVEVIGALYLV